MLRFSVQLIKLRKINSIPIGRQFSTSYQQLRQYSRIAGIAGTGILSLIAYGFMSDFNVYAHSKKKVSKSKNCSYVLFDLLSILVCIIV